MLLSHQKPLRNLSIMLNILLVRAELFACFCSKLLEAAFLADQEYHPRPCQVGFTIQMSCMILVCHNAIHQELKAAFIGEV